MQMMLPLVKVCKNTWSSISIFRSCKLQSCSNDLCIRENRAAPPSGDVNLKIFFLYLSLQMCMNFFLKWNTKGGIYCSKMSLKLTSDENAFYCESDVIAIYYILHYITTKPSIYSQSEQVGPSKN